VRRSSRIGDRRRREVTLRQATVRGNPAFASRLHPREVVAGRKHRRPDPLHGAAFATIELEVHPPSPIHPTDVPSGGTDDRRRRRKPRSIAGSAAGCNTAGRTAWTSIAGMALLERETYLAGLGRQLVAARHGRGSLAVVLGEAGIGKTSLVEEFCASAPQPVRILWGMCDPLVPPRPFAPIVDIAERVGGELRAALVEGHRDAVIDAALRTLISPRSDVPTIVVLDDLHWVDQATLDLIRVIARRIARLPALLIGTFRDDEVGPGHPLRLAIAEVPRGSTVEVRLPPLSEDAVARLAGDRRSGARAIHALTGGNPFFVTEILAGAPSDDGVPTSVRSAVLARVDRVSPAARSVLRAASVLGPACDQAVLLRIAGEQRGALDECRSVQLLEERAGAVSFRHELARRAVLGAIPADQERTLHQAALAALTDSGSTDAAQLARHAIGADDPAAVLVHAVAAAERAVTLGSHREAAAFFERALRHASGLEDPRRADLLDAYAREASRIDEAVAALEAQREAVTIWHRAGDLVREACGMIDLSGYLWLAGQVDAAISTATEAADRLEQTAPESPDLARALAVAAQRTLVSGRDDPHGLQQADRAFELAERLGDERTAVHALTTRSVLRIFLGDGSGWVGLESAVARSEAAGLPEETARALINLVEAARDMRRLRLADRYLAEAAAFLEERELDLFSHLLASRMAGLALDTGSWDLAALHARDLLEQPRVANPARVRALTVSGQIRARRGEPGAWSLLDEALPLAGSEYQDLVPLRVARAEAAWLEGDLDRCRAEAARGLALGGREISPWWWSEMAFWGWMAGAEGPLPARSELPFWLQVIGEPRAAAAAWLEVGSPYYAATAFVSAGGEEDLRQALRIFNDLGAVPMSRRAAAALQRIGASAIARGPRPRTRANPARMTDREVEILTLVESGLTNGEIAERLVLSVKTVEHHVSAILRKVGVRRRADAAAAARRIGSGPDASQDGDTGVTR
jgi:DNA-binding CsgD family transcriptional regulator